MDLTPMIFPCISSRLEKSFFDHRICQRTIKINVFFSVLYLDVFEFRQVIL